MTKDELRNIINMVWDGVEESKAGKITGTEFVGQVEQQVIKNVGFNVFINILKNIIPTITEYKTNSEIKMVEPKEKWEM